MSGYRVDSHDRHVIAEFRARGGVVGAPTDLSLLLLHHVGARSGIERVSPLAYWHVTDTTVALLASNRGAPRHPAWYHNLVANPTTTAEIGTETWTVRARVAAPDERRELITRLMQEDHRVAAAVSRTDREIPVVLLDLVSRI